MNTRSLMVNFELTNMPKLISDFCNDKFKYHPLIGIVVETIHGNVCVNDGDCIIQDNEGLKIYREVKE